MTKIQPVTLSSEPMKYLTKIVRSRAASIVAKHPEVYGNLSQVRCAAMLGKCLDIYIPVNALNNIFKEAGVTRTKKNRSSSHKWDYIGQGGIRDE